MTNYYVILGISNSATPEEIKAAFKKLAIQFHPDKHAGDIDMEERFKEINHAYQVLSNPYEKARHDLQLNFGFQQQTYQSYYSSPTASEAYRPPRPAYARPPYKRRAVNYRENWVATGYAFAFTLVVALLVVMVVGIKSYLDELSREQLMASRRATFVEIKGDYRAGNVDVALQKLNNLGSFFPTEEDIKAYKANLYTSLLFQAEMGFYNREYQRSLFYYELLEIYGERTPLPLKEHMAEAYLKTNQINQSIQKLNEILIAGYRKMDTYLKLALIHRDELHQMEDARRYFEIASDLAIKSYESVYGRGYMMVLSSKMLPLNHYTLYTGLADIYLQTGDYLKAVKATNWNTHIWPDSASNYLIAARGYNALGESKNACRNLSIARKLGFNQPIEFSCP